MNSNTKNTMLNVSKVFLVITLVVTCLIYLMFSVFSFAFIPLYIILIAVDVFLFILSWKANNKMLNDDYDTSVLVVSILTILFVSLISGILMTIVYVLDNQSVKNYNEDFSNKHNNVSKTKCSTCGATINENTKFCPNCGASISKLENKECSSCGYKNSSTDQFCCNCGQSLNNEKLSENENSIPITNSNNDNEVQEDIGKQKNTQKFVNVSQNIPQSSEEIKQRKTIVKTIEYCKICGAEKPEGAIRCEICGHDFTLDNWKN